MLKLFARAVVVLASVLAAVSADDSWSSTCAVSDYVKQDCGDVGTTEQQCLASGCCWYPEGQNSAAPWCYKPADGSQWYQLVSMSQTSNGYLAALAKVTAGSDQYGADITQLKLQVFYESADIVRIKITDATAPRWEIPSTVIDLSNPSTPPPSLNFKFTYVGNPFSFTITRTSDNVVVFQSSPALVYKDQYIELSTIAPSAAHVYGLGESARTTQALSRDHTYTLWGADIPAADMNVNLYGSYPFYLQLLNGSAYGAAMLNSNGMDIFLGESTLTYKMVGGVIDLYVFNGPSPQLVVQQLNHVIGHPAMIPYWALGFHNCKYGYTSLAQVEQVVANYSAAGIPLDTQWVDIDYMQNYRDFTTDSVNFPSDQMSAFVEKLHDNGQHFVVISDPGIMVYNGYDAYEQGLKNELFVKDISGGFYLGQVWPGPTYFPDFLNPNTGSYWTDQLQAFHDLVPVDGFWIDMNEVSNFCNTNGAGQVCANTASNGCPAPGASQTSCCLNCQTVSYSNSLDFPPYNIQNAKGLLSTNTMAMSATHYNNVSVYNAHNLYGLTEQIATQAALEKIRGQRSFVLSRSGFLSTGAHSAKWTGDNGATWNDLQASIVGIMDFNLFGIPMIGADICGFLYDTTEELCARWIEVGAFYPFSRDHNTLGAAPQELYLWPSVSQAAKIALGLRYQILPYMYTLFANANTHGYTVANSLWFNFPADPNTPTINGQFMLGSAVLVTPVLTQGATSVTGYFPAGLWYSLFTDELEIDASTGGTTATLNTPLTATNVHVYGKNIIPMQQAAMTTTAGRLTPFTLLAALCTKYEATGQLYWDDGEQINMQTYLNVSFATQLNGTTGVFSSTIVTNTFTQPVQHPVETIKILGKNLETTVTTATLKTSTKSWTLSGSNVVSTSQSLTFTGFSVDIDTAFTLTW